MLMIFLHGDTVDAYATGSLEEVDWSGIIASETWPGARRWPSSA